MKSILYGIVAFGIGCTPKTRNVESLAEHAQQEPIARALKNYLLENASVIVQDTFACQSYANETQGINDILVCYFEPTNIVNTYKDALIISFDTNATIFIDKGADSTLDELLFPGEAEPRPLETFSKRIQSDALESYAELLRKLYDATFESERRY